MYPNNLFHNIFFAFCMTAFLTSCAQLSSIDTASSIAKERHKEVSFPAKISLISLAKGFGSFDKKSKPEDNECLVIDKEKPEKSEEKFNKLVDKLIEEGAVKKTELDKEQIKEAFNLVKSGQFKSDVEHTFASLLINVRNLQSSFLTEIMERSRDPASSFDTIRNSPQYLQINPKNSVQCEEGIKKIFVEQNYDSVGACAPGAIGKIFDKLKRDETTSIVIETTRIFTNKNNRSSRLAIIAYAKMYGINITEENLDELNRFLDTSKESDFSPLIKIGIDKLSERYGGKDIQSFIKKKDSECNLS